MGIYNIISGATLPSFGQLHTVHTCLVWCITRITIVHYFLYLLLLCAAMHYVHIACMSQSIETSVTMIKLMFEFEVQDHTMKTF